MADSFTRPVPQAADMPLALRSPARKWELIALKWRSLAERRRGHIVDLYKSGRWTRYYTDEELLTEMRAADAMAKRWASIAPLPEERAVQAVEPSGEAAPDADRSKAA